MPEEAHAGETLAALDAGRAAEIVEELEDDDAADLLGELPVAEQERILKEVEDRADVDRLLRYDERTAGGLMTTHTVTVRDTDTVEQALDRDQAAGGGGHRVLPDFRGGSPIGGWSASCRSRT